MSKNSQADVLAALELAEDMFWADAVKMLRDETDLPTRKAVNLIWLHANAYPETRLGRSIEALKKRHRHRKDDQ